MANHSNCKQKPRSTESVSISTSAGQHSTSWSLTQSRIVQKLKREEVLNDALEMLSLGFGSSCFQLLTINYPLAVSGR